MIHDIKEPQRLQMGSLDKAQFFPLSNMKAETNGLVWAQNEAVHPEK